MSRDRSMNRFYTMIKTRWWKCFDEKDFWCLGSSLWTDSSSRHRWKSSLKLDGALPDSLFYYAHRLKLKKAGHASVFKSVSFLTLESHNLSQLFDVYVHSVCCVTRTTSVDRFRLQTSLNNLRYNWTGHYWNPFCHTCIVESEVSALFSASFLTRKGIIKVFWRLHWARVWHCVYWVPATTTSMLN